MLRLRKFLCGCFGLLALLYLPFSVSTIPALLYSPQLNGVLPVTHPGSATWRFVELFYREFARIMLATPLLLGLLYGMVWWTFKDGRPSARHWAIAASLASILMSLPIIVTTIYLSSHSEPGATRLLVFSGFGLILGIAGLEAFAPRNSMAQVVLEASKTARIAGDGTSSLFDGLAWLLGLSGVVAGMLWFLRWGAAQHLPVVHGYRLWLEILVAILAVIFLHESGHASAGLVTGMRLSSIRLGPFQWSLREGSWKFRFYPARLLSVGGGVAVVPTRLEQSRWREICVIAGGPFTSLCTGLIACADVLTCKGQPWEQSWQPLAFFATSSLVMFTVNLIPIRPEGAYSDGARIYQIFRGGPLADLYRAVNIAESTLVTPLRPRDYDIQAIQRASRTFTHGRQGFFLRLYASSYFLDCGNLPEAGEALAEAESIYRESSINISTKLHTTFVFGDAFLRRDAAGARQWWERLEARHPTHFGVDYYLALSALLWIEGCVDDAREAWTKGNALAQQLPAIGSCEFDRHRCLLLRSVLDELPPGAGL
jgi:hypothetical protein